MFQKKNTLQEAVLNHIKANPGSTYATIATALDITEKQASQTLSHLYVKKFVTRQRQGYHYVYMLAEQPKPAPQVIGVPKLYVAEDGVTLVTDEPELPLEPSVELSAKKAEAVAELLSDQVFEIDRLRKEVAGLRQWKADAIAKYPDLDVDPLLLKARQIVADLYPNEDIKRDVLDGGHDAHSSVKGTLAALRLSREG